MEEEQERGVEREGSWEVEGLGRSGVGARGEGEGRGGGRGSDQGGPLCPKGEFDSMMLYVHV